MLKTLNVKVGLTYSLHLCPTPGPNSEVGSYGIEGYAII